MTHPEYKNGAYLFSPVSDNRPARFWRALTVARDFIDVFRLYWRCQPATYALKAAWRIAVQKLPF